MCQAVPGFGLRSPAGQCYPSLCTRFPEPDAAKVMVINDSEDEDTLDSSWGSDGDDSLASTDRSFSSAVSGEMDSSVQLDSSLSLSACSFESFDESED